MPKNARECALDGEPGERKGVSVSWLLIFVPVTLALEYFSPDRSHWIFLTSALAILPLAGWTDHSTEALAARTGDEPFNAAGVFAPGPEAR